MIGLNFHECNDFLLEMSFNSSQLDFSSLSRLDLSKIKILDSSLKGVDFGKYKFRR